MLKQELIDTLIDERELRYQFTWPDKQKSVLLANTPINKTLRPCKEESVDFDNTQNLYIEGDNLEVLKLLQETYLGKIKMIYIDPPYNTGNDFVYNDDFAQEADEYKENSGQYDEQGNRLVQNTESNGRFHTDWLNMIYPRLRLAKDLLSDDGVIFISIDDNESYNLKKVCDEIFGIGNFIAELINITGASQNGEGVKIQKNTESCFVYAKNFDCCFPNKVDKADESLRNLNDSPSSFITRPDMGYTIYYNPTTRDKIAVKDYDKNKISSNIEAEVYTDNQGLIQKGYIPIRPGYRNGQLNRWRWGMDTFYERIDEVEVLPSKNSYSVYFKQKGYNPPKNILNYVVGTSEIKELFDGERIFDYSKSTKLLKYLCNIGTDKDSLILDFFSGSATTAHAVMQLNAEDGGNRKFIMVQLPEPCDEKSEAYKAGYKNICEIGKERIRRAGTKIKAENGEKAQDLDIGFRVLKLDSSNMKDVYYKPEEYSQTLLGEMQDNIKPDRTALDLLFQVMLELGKPLSAKIAQKAIGGKSVFNVDDGDLIACFEDNITAEIVTEIAKAKPLYAVFRDSGLSSDSVAANFEQIFATYSPNTVRKVL